MVQAAIPEEIKRHFEAVLALSKREILLRLLREAEHCIGLDQVNAAAILAGVAFEQLDLTSDPNIREKYAQSFEHWRELRNRAAHPAVAGAQMNPEAVSAMLTGIRMLLDQFDATQAESRPFGRIDAELAKVRGKYAFVSTSVDDFMRRKHEDLELENRE